MEIENFDNRPKSKNGELIVTCRESSSGSVTHKPLDWPNCDRERAVAVILDFQKYLEMCKIYALASLYLIVCSNTD